MGVGAGGLMKGQIKKSLIPIAEAYAVFLIISKLNNTDLLDTLGYDGKSSSAFARKWKVDENTLYNWRKFEGDFRKIYLRTIMGEMVEDIPIAAKLLLKKDPAMFLKLTVPEWANRLEEQNKLPEGQGEKSQSLTINFGMPDQKTLEVAAQIAEDAVVKEQVALSEIKKSEEV